jgi:hypothetical protein
MRDALSIFDQMVSFCGNEITYKKGDPELERYGLRLPFLKIGDNF